jgi:predicted DNA-binding transcriptional regulator YafY
MRNDVTLGYEAPIDFHKGEKGYFYRDENYTIKKVPLGEEDLEALWFASQTLYQFKDIPVFQAFEQMIGKLREHVSLSDDEFGTEYIDHMLFDDSHKGQGDRFIPDLLKAIREHRRTRLEYSFHNDKKVDKTYLIEPYLLKQFRLRWYLIGLDKAVEKIKTFGLDRIKEIEVLSEEFISPGFVAKEYFKDTYGISHSDEGTEHVIMEVERSVSKYLMAAPWHSSMRLKSRGEERDRIEMQIVINIDLVNELMTWMPDIKVIAPERLRIEIVKRCESAVKRNIRAT